MLVICSFACEDTLKYEYVSLLSALNDYTHISSHFEEDPSSHIEVGRGAMALITLVLFKHKVWSCGIWEDGDWVHKKDGDTAPLVKINIKCVIAFHFSFDFVILFLFGSVLMYVRY